MPYYEAFVREGVVQGRRPELVGGGLIRSLGGWSQVLSLRRKGIKGPYDERVLGRGESVEQLIEEVEERELETLRLFERVRDLRSLGADAVNRGGDMISPERERFRREENQFFRTISTDSNGSVSHNPPTVLLCLPSS